jgi:hypothetical protein
MEFGFVFAEDVMYEFGHDYKHTDGLLSLTKYTGF